MVYDFALDVQFVSYGIITEEELKLVWKVIDILNENKDFVISKLKKYTVQEYEE